MKNIIKRLLIVFDELVISLYFKLKRPPEKTILNVDYSSASFGNCGLACADMLINYLGGSLPTNWDQFNKKEYFLDSIGWKHQGLCDLIYEYSGVKFDVFKNKSYLYVMKKISEGYPVITSIKVPAPDNLDQRNVYSCKDPKKKMESHLVVCVGYDKENIIVNDPRNIGVYTKQLSVQRSIFKKVFTGNGIAVSENLLK